MPSSQVSPLVGQDCGALGARLGASLEGPTEHLTPPPGPSSSLGALPTPGDLQVGVKEPTVHGQAPSSRLRLKVPQPSWSLRMGPHRAPAHQGGERGLQAG